MSNPRHLELIATSDLERRLRANPPAAERAAIVRELASRGRSQAPDAKSLFGEKGNTP